MDNYEVLGVSKDASAEEIKRAYEDKLKQIDEEVINKKNADAFKKVINDAYNELGVTKTSENTLVMSREDFDRMLEEEEGYDEDGYDYYDDDEYDEEEERREKRERKRRSRSKNKRSRRSRDDGNDDERKKGRRRKKYRNEEEDDDYNSGKFGIINLLKIPLKILAMPIIIVLSAILIVFDIISAAIWAVTKILILGAVAVAAIHGYQIYTGTSDIRYDVFAACAGVFTASVILPVIIRTIPKPLEILNKKLKAFVF